LRFGSGGEGGAKKHQRNEGGGAANLKVHPLSESVSGQATFGHEREKQNRRKKRIKRNGNGEGSVCSMNSV
jgi:hypothetical protein